MVFPVLLYGCESWSIKKAECQRIDILDCGVGEHSFPTRRSSDLITNQRHYFADKGPSSQSCGFSSSHVWMWELEYKESWVLKNWCFWMWCWRLLRVPSTISNQSILEEMHPDYSLERLMLKPKLQYCGQYWKSWWEELTHLKRPWCWERLKVGGGGDDRGRDGWMASLTQ